MMRDLDAQTILIPSEPCDWPQDIYIGKEVEFTPVGGRGPSRSEVAGAFVRRLAQVIPSSLRSPGSHCDIFTPLGRIYQEMSEFVEVAGPTCRSGEAVAWAFEAAMEALSRVMVGGNGQAAVLCHTPSDYNDHLSRGEGPAHSTGCHFNMLTPSLNIDQVRAFVALTSPLNAVFGPGGWTWSPQGAPRFSCDPRAYHVARLVGGAAHGDGAKPYLLFRNEPYACPPLERVQCAAFGAPRSPLSSWLQAELLPMALRAALAGGSPPWCAVDPITILRAGPREPIALKAPWPARRKLVTKAALAEETILWLTEFAEGCALRPDAFRRVARIRELGVQAARAGAATAAQPPLFPTDIAIKQGLFDRAVQACGFADLSELDRACTACAGDGNVRRAVDTLILTDVFFSSPSCRHSTYELAGRSALFVRPRFEHPIDLHNLSRLPAGVARRDRIRASLLASPGGQGNVCFCDWDQLHTGDGTVMSFPDPWSDLNQVKQR
jgi:hypothetical protein